MYIIVLPMQAFFICPFDAWCASLWAIISHSIKRALKRLIVFVLIYVVCAIIALPYCGILYSVYLLITDSYTFYTHFKEKKMGGLFVYVQIGFLLVRLYFISFGLNVFYVAVNSWDSSMCYTRLNSYQHFFIVFKDNCKQWHDTAIVTYQDFVQQRSNCVAGYISGYTDMLDWFLMYLKRQFTAYAAGPEEFSEPIGENLPKTINLKWRDGSLISNRAQYLDYMNVVNENPKGIDFQWPNFGPNTNYSINGVPSSGRFINSYKDYKTFVDLQADDGLFLPKFDKATIQRLVADFKASWGSAVEDNRDPVDYHMFYPRGHWEDIPPYPTIWALMLKMDGVQLDINNLDWSEVSQKSLSLFTDDLGCISQPLNKRQTTICDSIKAIYNIIGWNTNRLEWTLEQKQALIQVSKSFEAQYEELLNNPDNPTLGLNRTEFLMVCDNLHLDCDQRLQWLLFYALPVNLRIQLFPIFDEVFQRYCEEEPSEEVSIQQHRVFKLRGFRMCKEETMWLYRGLGLNMTEEKTDQVYKSRGFDTPGE